MRALSLKPLLSFSLSLTLSSSVLDDSRVDSDHYFIPPLTPFHITRVPGLTDRDLPVSTTDPP